MDAVLNYRINDFYGILNGVDYSEWNPIIDKFLPSNYDFNSLENKQINKIFLCDKLELDYNLPLIGMVTRLVEQKGIDNSH